MKNKDIEVLSGAFKEMSEKELIEFWNGSTENSSLENSKEDKNEVLIQKVDLIRELIKKKDLLEAYNQCNKLLFMINESSKEYKKD